MRSKRMRSKSMRMRSKSKRMRSKSKSKRTRTKRMLSKRMRSKRKTMRRTRRIMRGGDYHAAPTPTPGGAYFAGSPAPFPSGTHYRLSPVGVPSGALDPSVPGGHIGGGRRGRGKGMHGGGLSSFISTILPDEIVNIGRSVPAAVGHMADKFNGVISSGSSQVYPTQQPNIYQPPTSGAMATSPIDIMGAFNRANASAGSI